MVVQRLRPRPRLAARHYRQGQVDLKSIWAPAISLSPGFQQEGEAARSCREDWEAAKYRTPRTGPGEIFTSLLTRPLRADAEAIYLEEPGNEMQGT